MKYFLFGLLSLIVLQAQSLECVEVKKNFTRRVDVDTESLCKAAFEYYPFGVIFSKKSPSNLTKVNFYTAFCYFYFSPNFERLSLFNRFDMCDGKTNAKSHFPDYVAYFEDDSTVMNHYTYGKVLAICEPWAPKGIHSFVYTRKTAFFSNGTGYMLGCFDLVDDVSLGIAKFKQIFHDAYATPSPMSLVPILSSWFYDAFNALPNGWLFLKKMGLSYVRIKPGIS